MFMTLRHKILRYVKRWQDNTGSGRDDYAAVHTPRFFRPKDLKSLAALGQLLPEEEMLGVGEDPGSPVGVGINPDHWESVIPEIKKKPWFWKPKTIMNLILIAAVSLVLAWLQLHLPK